MLAALIEASFVQKDMLLVGMSDNIIFVITVSTADGKPALAVLARFFAV